ncbi:hypothetical protein [Brevundimonas sp. Leaf168]|uniref:hypothetical protein n=1 Tax=Brevundimonas sp. Leaf168 TaxID=1736283 RepID=UPI000AFE768B|nr:hypothetical protein [Brevundimonas sp. Leaf168]
MAPMSKIWALIARRTIFWLAIMTLLNLAAYLITGSSAPWVILPIAALFLTLGMMALT